ncbi:MAG: hypothetical protein JW910_19285 [Anaerolineae bacterium]|nr:hypothetical protein [Anaerolineae bacterium]
MSFSVIISIVGAVTTGVFSALLLMRWRVKRRAHLLAWGLGLAFYCLGMASQVILAQSWNALFFRLWYWSGALIVAPWLGQGTVFLLVRKGNRARNLALLLAIASVIGLVWLFLTPLDATAWQPGADMTEVFKDIMPSGGVRFLAPILNIWGTVTLVGGALYSAYLFRRKAILPQRLTGNILIAIGGIIPAFGGTLVLLGRTEYKYLAELVGAILIFAGYLLATSSAPQVQKHHTAAA